jgi:Cd2+/Zn2+-exporting ATPase
MDWIYKGLVLLVIGCPCALVISTPVTIISALACAAREGIVIKGGKYLEEGRLLKNVALDKTGTITTGRPVCTDVIPVSPKLSENAALERASALSQLSDHPVSTAITHAARKAKSLGGPAEDLKAIPGAGVEAKVGRAVLKLVSPAAVKGGSPSYQAAVRKLESEGKTVSVLADLFGPVAVFGVADTVKSGVRESIADLKAAGMTPWMLTGDNERAAGAIAASVGIDHAEARLLPQQKLEKISSLQKDGLTAMVGDGINDAPALAASDIGFAMGVKGTDTAIEAASVMLMDDNIGKIAFFKRLAAKTYRFLVANIAFAIAVKIVFAVLDFAGLATMWMAVFADTGVTLIVVANGMRLLRAAPGIHSDMESERPETHAGKVAEDSPLSAAA